MGEDLKDAKILIVDDQQVNIDVLVGLLNISGYTNHVSITDSNLVMSSIRENQPDLILLDLMMPDVSGFDILDMIKADASLNKNMSILVLTADASNETKRKALQLGASDFLTKPFDLTEVNLRIKNLLTTVKLVAQLSNYNQLLEQKVAERTGELNTSLENIKKQNEILRDIAWTQSHIVRAPLSRIMGVVYFLQSQKGSEQNTESTEHVSHSHHFDQAQLMQAIIDSAVELDQIVREITEKTQKANLNLG